MPFTLRGDVAWCLGTAPGDTRRMARRGPEKLFPTIQRPRLGAAIRSLV